MTKFNWSRSLTKDCELHHTSAETMIHVACVHLFLKTLLSFWTGSEINEGGNSETDNRVVFRRKE